MTENEVTAFRLCFGFYEKWREVVLETDEQWDEFARDVGKLAAELEKAPSVLGPYLLEAFLDAFGELYKNGMKPVQTGYLGREDM